MTEYQCTSTNLRRRDDDRGPHARRAYGARPPADPAAETRAARAVLPDPSDRARRALRRRRRANAAFRAPCCVGVAGWGADRGRGETGCEQGFLGGRASRARPQHRLGGEFFAKPADPTQRRYEALRAYLLEHRPAGEVAEQFGYSVQTLHSMVRDFRAGRREFFLSPRPGPKSAPAKEAARARIVALRHEGHSIDEIASALAAEGRLLNRTGIAEVLRAEGFERLWRRPQALRGGPRRERLP